MKQTGIIASAGAFLFVCLLGSMPLLAQGHTIDAQKSFLRVHVHRTGFFSAFGHDHEIEAPIAGGTVNESNNPSVELHLDAAKLRVIDRDASASDRNAVQKTMEGPEVLDVARYPEIRFHSTRIEKQRADEWTVEGELNLHGQARPIRVRVTKKDGKFRGSAIVSQRDFGMKPVSVAGGTVKVKNEVKIEFEIAVAGKS
jgi:polyisoprenoid-binding protein YceI